MIFDPELNGPNGSETCKYFSGGGCRAAGISLSGGGVEAVAGVPCRGEEQFYGVILSRNCRVERSRRGLCGRCGDSGFRIPEPDNSHNFRFGLGSMLGRQWELINIHPAGEIKIELLRAIVHGNSLLTSYNRISPSPSARRLSGGSSSSVWQSRTASSLWSRP